MSDGFTSYYENEHLAHYGIKGQKWGLRRFQNSDGTLTAEGKVRYGSGLSKEDKKAIRKEYKADNKAAFEKGKKATVLGEASRFSDKQVSAARKRLEKDPTNEKKQRNLEIHEEVDRRLKSQNDIAISDMKEHYNSLVSKYGKDAVKDIKINKKGHISERVNDASDVGLAVGTTMLGLSAAVLGSPVMMIGVTPSPSSLGLQEYRSTLREVRKEYKTK